MFLQGVRSVRIVQLFSEVLALEGKASQIMYPTSLNNGAMCVLLCGEKVSELQNDF